MILKKRKKKKRKKHKTLGYYAIDPEEEPHAKRFSNCIILIVLFHHLYAVTNYI